MAACHFAGKRTCEILPHGSTVYEIMGVLRYAHRYRVDETCLTSALALGEHRSILTRRRQENHSQPAARTKDPNAGRPSSLTLLNKSGWTKSLPAGREMYWQSLRQNNPLRQGLRLLKR